MIKVYFDENMPPHVAKGFEIIQKPEAVKSNFPKIEIKHFNNTDFKGATDKEWLTKLRDTNSFIITKDIKISHRKDEFEAYKKAGLGLFLLRGASKKQNISVWQTLTILSKHWEFMVGIMLYEKRPFMYLVSEKRKPRSYKL